MKKFRGVFPALYACYDSMDRIDPRQVRMLTRWLCQSGVSGLYINGAAGDSRSLSLREKAEVMENVMAEAGGRVLVLCQVCCSRVDDMLTLARSAVDCGVDAVVAGPCAGHDSTWERWRALSNAVPGTDTIFCDMPLPSDEAEKQRLLRFADETGMQGVIPARSGITDVAAWHAILPEHISVFTTHETQAAPAIAMGADAVTGPFCTVMPELMVRLESTLRYAGIHRAASDQGMMLQVCGLLESCGSPMDAAREIVRRISGAEPGRRRGSVFPLAEADAMNAEKAYAILAGR